MGSGTWPPTPACSRATQGEHLRASPELLSNLISRAVITPNAMEFSRLVKAVLHKDVAPAVNPDPRLVEDLATAMGHITILHKGCPDLISNGKVSFTRRR